MVTIVKGDSKIIVTKGTFESQFKPLGYQIASEEKGADKKSAPISVKSEIKEEVEEDNKEEKVVEEQQKEKIQEKYGFKNNKKKGK